MPTYPTRQPVDVVVEVEAGDVSITAGDRDDATVDVGPTDGSHDPDVRAAEQTHVELVAGRLLVKAPRQRRVVRFGRVGSVEVRVHVPAGSRVRAQGGAVAFRCSGPLADCRLETGMGDLHVQVADSLDLKAGAGSVVVDRSAGTVDVTTGSGSVRVGRVDGPAVIKTANGDSWIGEAAGDVRVQTANGSITVERAGGDVVAKTAHGNVRVGDLRGGASSLKSAMGEIEVGIPAGTAAHLDVHTHFGRVRNDLEAAGAPATTDATVELQARTGFGDIVIHRATATAGRRSG